MPSSTLRALVDFYQTSYALQQLLPFLVLFGFPALTLALLAARRRVPTWKRNWWLIFVPGPVVAQMVLEALGVGFLWSWASGNGSGAGASGGKGEGEDVKEARGRKRKMRNRTKSEAGKVDGVLAGGSSGV